MPDTTAPSLRSLNLPATIYLKGDKQAVTLEVGASDHGDGVQAVQVWLNSPIQQVEADGQAWVSDTIFFDAAVDSFSDGSSTLKLTLSSATLPGTYSIRGMHIIDKAGNERSYTVDALKALGIRTTFEISSSAPAKATLETTSSFKLPDGVVKLVAKGSGNIGLTGNALDNIITGNMGKNTINGLAGSDNVDGGFGNDVLYGGSGTDAFLFTTKLGTSASDRKVNFDTLNDFSVEDDSLFLDNAIFKKLGSGTPTKPKLLSGKFFSLDKAKDKDDYIIYSKKTGVLSYDADGSGKGQAVEFVQLKKGLAMTYKDVFVI